MKAFTRHGRDMSEVTSSIPSPRQFLTPGLAAGSLDLRLQTEADLPFVRALYISHRWDEVRYGFGWPDDQCRAFLSDQARLQWQHYATHYHDAQFLIIERSGAPIGRFYLFHHHPHDLRIVEIGLMPVFRGQGIGGALLSQVQAYASAQDKSCSIHVEQSNPARRLYARLGFADAMPVGPYVRMEWHPAGGGPAAQVKTA